jgi:hypothetical protein
VDHLAALETLPVLPVVIADLTGSRGLDALAPVFDELLFGGRIEAEAARFLDNDQASDQVVEHIVAKFEPLFEGEWAIARFEVLPQSGDTGANLLVGDDLAIH